MRRLPAPFDLFLATLSGISAMYARGGHSYPRRSVRADGRLRRISPVTVPRPAVPAQLRRATGSSAWQGHEHAEGGHGRGVPPASGSYRVLGGGAMVEAGVLTFVAPGARPLAPQVTALPPLAAYHDPRWLFAFNQSWLGFTGVLAALLGVRSAVDAVLVRPALARGRPARRRGHAARVLLAAERGLRRRLPRRAARRRVRAGDGRGLPGRRHAQPGQRVSAWPAPCGHVHRGRGHRLADA